VWALRTFWQCIGLSPFVCSPQAIAMTVVLAPRTPSVLGAPTAPTVASASTILHRRRRRQGCAPTPAMNPSMAIAMTVVLAPRTPSVLGAPTAPTVASASTDYNLPFTTSVRRPCPLGTIIAPGALQSNSKIDCSGERR